MLQQIVLGAGVSLANIAIHVVVVAWVVLMARRAAAADRVARPFWRLVAVTSVAAVALMAGHVIEVAVWAIVYALVGIAPGANPVYFAFVNYTTLGYGDVLPAVEWQLIGPITAMNGMLLFGLSTAVLFEVLRTIAQSLQLPLSKAN
ncbi:MAG: ion channel [Xanthobacteraceae bacterium]